MQGVKCISQLFHIDDLKKIATFYKAVLNLLHIYFQLIPRNVLMKQILLLFPFYTKENQEGLEKSAHTISIWGGGGLDLNPQSNSNRVMVWITLLFSLTLFLCAYIICQKPFTALHMYDSNQSFLNTINQVPLLYLLFI